MNRNVLCRWVLVFVTVCGALRAGMVTRRWGRPPKGPPSKARDELPVRPIGYATELSATPSIDGKLTEKVWANVAALKLALTLDGSARAAQPTEVRLFHDKTTLYMAFRCTEPLLGKVKATRRNHDGAIWEDDSVEIFLGLRGAYYHLGVNAAGSTYDGKAKDRSWGSGLRAAAARGAGEWTAEIAIPLAKMTGGGRPPGRWTANFTRSRRVTGALEESAWSPTFSGDSHVPRHFGELRFGEPPPRKEPPPAGGLAKGAAGVEVLPCKGGEGIARFDLAALPKKARIYRADLLVFRTGHITGQDDDARVDIVVHPLFERSAAGAEPRARAKALALRPPWFDRFDATEAVRRWAAGATNGGFFVKACPRWNAQATCLDVAYEGSPSDVPPQAKGLKVLHRKGQTFIVFQEIDDRSAEASPTWGELKARLGQMDAERVVRYQIYRHRASITAASLHEAELLAEVKPMSGYNVLGRSVDQLIALHRRRAVDDIEFAKRLACSNYFSRYQPDMPEMGEVPIKRLAIEDGKPLPPRAGLHVHHPSEPGKAHYAVVSVVDGVANTRDFSPANSLAKPIEETIGLGEPVFQGDADVTVFFDYPGRRSHYVQWAAPPLASLPDQYYNWGVFVPAGFRSATKRRLSVFFHDGRQRYLKPPWPHRNDTALLSPHDAPYRSYGYGCHESLGTLRSFRQGRVRPFFARRVDAMVGWAVRRLNADAGRISCGGRGHWGGTAALQYGLRRPGRIAYVMAEGSPDPDPQQTPYVFSFYGRGDRRKTPRPAMEAVWGRAEWSVLAETGKPIWDEMSLPAYVRANGRTRTLAFLSLGAGGMHLTWKQQTDLMKAYLATHNAFMAEFFWGSSAHRPLPVTADQGDHPFEPRSDRPILACNANSRHPNPGFFPKQFDTGKRGYSGGSRLNTRPRWGPDDMVDAPDRLEVTIYAARRVVYAGRVTCDVWIRNTRQFRPKPGRKLVWTVTDSKTKREVQKGESLVDQDGLIPIPGLKFADPARLVVRPAPLEGGKL